jgi:hypothetical protein
MLSNSCRSTRCYAKDMENASCHSGLHFRKMVARSRGYSNSSSNTEPIMPWPRPCLMLFVALWQINHFQTNKQLPNWAAIGPCRTKSGESPQSSAHCVPRIYFWLPCNHSVNQSRVEYTSLELRQIALEQIRILPARLEVSGRGSDRPSSYSQPKALHPQPSPYPQSSGKDFTTLTTPVYNCDSYSIHYAGLFIRRILIGRVTDFHIENVFWVT